LHVGSANDPLEQEADHVAEQVMSKSASAGSTSGAGPSVRRASASGYHSAPLMASPVVREVLRSPGQPLDEATRAYFEPRFRHDLSAVRVHADARAGAAAQGIQARACTLGSDIAFAPGEFQPGTQGGRRLIAHELAHVVQQDNEPGVIRRKIKCDPRAKIDGYLFGRGVKGFTEANNTYDHAKGGAGSFEQELLIDMLASPRVFHVDGDTDAAAGANMAAHVKARTGIVTFASKKQYKFAALSGWSMNPAFYDWDVSKRSWNVKQGVDPKAAWEDVNVNPQLYAIGCAAATDITMKGGSGGANIIDKPSPDQADWVAGDAGYVENTKFPQQSSNIGLMGENIIYTGGGMFWGHFTGTVTYRTLADWVAMVNSWNGGAKVDVKRELPATGLLDK
jgi:uncharacterized protein DUF4157/protein-glutamine gamma-glutamyltransferase-like protein